MSPSIFQLWQRTEFRKMPPCLAIVTCSSIILKLKIIRGHLTNRMCSPFPAAVLQGMYCTRNMILIAQIHCNKKKYAFATRIALFDLVYKENSPLWQPGMGDTTHTEQRLNLLATRTGKLAQMSDLVSAVHHKRVLFPYQDPCHVNCGTHNYLWLK